MTHQTNEHTSTFHPGFLVECVILGFYENKLKVLLNKFETSRNWTLQSGLVYKDEDVDAAAYRHLNARTGLKDLYFRQFYLFGNADRPHQEHESNRVLQGVNISEGAHDWFMSRFISVGYYAFVNYEKVQLPQHLDESETCEWFDLDNLPELYADHGEILDKALEIIRTQVGYLPIGYKLLPSKFTMPELRTIYEILLGRPLDRRNFQRKILSVGLIKKLNESRKAGAHKAPLLYAFDHDKYKQALNKELLLDLKNAEFDV